MAGEFGKRALWGEGPYEVEYLCEDGIWKIEHLHWYQTFIVPYEGGWIDNPDATQGHLAAAGAPAPDRPPSERYETWPGVYIPPQHYETPTETFPALAAVETGADPATEALARALGELEARLRCVHDVLQIENLVAEYGYCLDKQRWEAFTRLFTQEATMEISERGIYVGRASIRRALELFGPQGVEREHVHNHIQMQPIVHLSADGTRAWVRSRAFSQLGVFRRGGIWHGGVYENALVKDAGHWKLETDHVYTTYFAQCAGGWTNGARPTAKVSKDIPPDRPPSVIYESFPEVYIPPFHYRHPVTGQAIATPGGTADRVSSGPAASSAAAGRSASGRESPPDAGARAGTADSAAFQALGALDAKRLPAELRALPERVAALQRRTERLADEQAIETLQRSYGYFVDKALWKDAADLFTQDGTLEIGGRGVFVGRKRVLEYLEWLAPEGLVRGKLFDHLQLQPIVTVAPDGRTAKGRWRFFAQVGDHGKTGLWGIGTYENEYVKEDGVWKIAALHSYFRMYAPYAEGWGKTALPNTRPEKDLPPDRPPTVVHEIYPATFIPDCHYPNPVTGRLSGARAATGSDRD